MATVSLTSSGSVGLLNTPEQSFASIRKSEPTTSIRRRLLIFLLPPLATLMLATVYGDYRAAMIFARTTFDQRLTDTALALAAEVRVAGGELHAATLRRPPTSAGVDRESYFYYYITGPHGQLLTGNTRLPSSVGNTNPSYADVSVGSEQVRLVTYRLRTEAGIATINVAGTDDSRTGPVRFILGSTWLIGFIQLDITLLLVWIGVHFGLKPLLAVRGQIEIRSARDLQPLEVNTIPTEVRPLVDALNLLFEMLGAASRTQRQFVADTAHQLRTPIAGLLGQLEVLMREHSTAPLYDRLSALHDGMSRLGHSANQLLALARAEPSANLADRFEAVDLKALAEQLLEHNVDRSIARGLDLGAEPHPASVTGNAKLLDDLLSNLIDNALTYTPPGGRVTVRSGLDYDRPFLEVEDDGPGIPETERVRVLSRFYRLPGSPGHGCGLGLAIVDEIARLHRATLTIDAAADGRGTRIRILFPRPDAVGVASFRPGRNQTETSFSL